MVDDPLHLDRGGRRRHLPNVGSCPLGCASRRAANLGGGRDPVLDHDIAGGGGRAGERPIVERLVLEGLGLGDAGHLAHPVGGGGRLVVPALAEVAGRDAVADLCAEVMALRGGPVPAAGDGQRRARRGGDVHDLLRGRAIVEDQRVRVGRRQAGGRRNRDQGVRGGHRRLEDHLPGGGGVVAHDFLTGRSAGGRGRGAGGRRPRGRPPPARRPAGPATSGTRR